MSASDQVPEGASGAADLAPRGASSHGKPLCGAIRAKGFFVYTEEPPPPTEWDTAVFWCLKTMTSVGPDGDMVHRTCCDASRQCFEGPRS